MPLKSWILQRMNRVHAVVGRPDLAQRPARASGRASVEPSLHAVPSGERGASEPPTYLGAYAPLIGAIRDELEHFVSSQLRLHLAIAERDRYLLVSIDVECVDGGDGVDLLRRFEREFSPEQIKRFLARDVIAHLPNASAIDLSQFAGLNAAQAKRNVPAADDPYEALLSELRATTRAETPRSFDVSLMGRWVEAETGGTSRAAQSPATPLAGSRLQIGIEDADGTRQVMLSGVVPKRRYSIGNGGCDITVNGTFASRRHSEIWLENGTWWVADAGSTNGTRVETSERVLGRAGGQSPTAGMNAAIEVVPGARIVLSALADGTSGEYPRLLLRQAEAKAVSVTPPAPVTKAMSTPVTPLAAAQPRKVQLAVTSTMASGERTLALDDRTLPIRIGRSRNQDVVVDWAHGGVSGHHLDITSTDANSVEVEVHGDNGVNLEGVDHAPGARLRWSVGERLTLGRASGSEPQCALLLTKSPRR